MSISKEKYEKAVKYFHTDAEYDLDKGTFYIYKKGITTKGFGEKAKKIGLVIIILSVLAGFILKEDSSYSFNIYSGTSSYNSGVSFWAILFSVLFISLIPGGIVAFIWEAAEGKSRYYFSEKELDEIVKEYKLKKGHKE